MDYERQRRRMFQEIKGMSNERFWNWMNQIHSKAYYKAIGHYAEAAEIVLPPRYRQPLYNKAAEIREQWDGLNDIVIDFAELTLRDILLEVQREMTRAAGIHGATFASLAEAREAIDEEYAEVWEAIEQRDLPHAGVELIQLIGVLVKLLRGLNQLAEVVVDGHAD